jgi:hypothetical protein
MMGKHLYYEYSLLEKDHGFHETDSSHHVDVN